MIALPSVFVVDLEIVEDGAAVLGAEAPAAAEEPVVEVMFV